MNIEEPNIKCLIDFDWWHHDSNNLNILNEYQRMLVYCIVLY